MYSFVSRIPSRRFRCLQFSTFSIITPRSAPASSHTTSCSSDKISIEGSDPPQAYPLSGYYSDILSGSFPHAHRAGSPRSVAPPPSSTTKRQSPADKMSIIFGSRLAGPSHRSPRYNPSTTPVDSTWKTINRVAIPPRPTEPDNCCMSGCVHCVWDDFREDMEAWAARVQQARARARATSPARRDTRQDSRPEVESASSSMDDDGGGSETSWAASTTVDDELFAGIPVGIREFMKVEKKLRDKHRKERDLV
ncbi:Oxidoreductase-like protein, N-terminal domain containing protein [Elaphomyces granulatus]